MLNKCILKPAMVLGIAMMAAAGASVHGQIGPGGAGQERIVAESRFTVTNPPAQTDLVQLVVDFAPGAWTSVHTHGGQAINLVLEGEITLRHGSHDRPHKAGQAWTDGAGVVHAAGNTGSGNARLLTNFLLPVGAPQTTEIEASRFEPTVLHQARFALPALPAATEIVQQVIDVPPGGRAARAGLVAALVVDGEVTIGGKKYTAGESWFAQAGAPLAGENSSPANARVFLTYLQSRAANR
jgi:quercetin dioxygenase-like cupin family protein